MTPADRIDLQIAGNGLQIHRSGKDGTVYHSAKKTPQRGDFLRVANRAVIAAEMSDLLTRMEGGDNAAIDEALELIERLGPETIAEVGALVTALERAAMEAAVLGAMGEEVGGADASSVRNAWSRDERGRFASGGSWKGREFQATVSDALAQQLGIDSQRVYADAGHLAAKHPEYFKDAREAREYVDHVLSAPTHLLPGNQPDHRLIVRKEDAPRAVALEVELRGGKYRVRSAHTLGEQQFQQKWEKALASGQGATLGVSRVDRLPNAETPSRCWAALARQLPEAIYKMYHEPTFVKPSNGYTPEDNP